MGGEWLYMHTAGRLLVEEDRGMSMWKKEMRVGEAQGC